MNENEKIVTENPEVEQVAEQPEKTYTQKEVDAVVGKRVARIQKQHSREMEPYRELESVLKAGMGKEDVGEITQDLRTFYSERKGIKMPQRSDYSEKDNEYLAERDVNAIFSEGIEEAEEEFDRLEKKGTKMTKREQATFRILADRLQSAKNVRELAQIGVTADEYNSPEYQEFRKQFNSNVPEEKRYKMYQQNQPKKEVKSMGSMKSSTTQDNGLKDYYSYEEAMKFTKQDFDKNPELYKRVQQSMPKWYKK